MRSASVVVVASGSTRWPGLEAKVNPMNINQPRILAVAALLALAGLATPTTAQIDPEACITGIFTELPSPSGAGCTPEEPEPCPEGSTGVTDPLCIPDDADPTAGVPCLDPEAEGCPTEGGNPTGCEPDVPEAFLTCLVDFLTGQDPGVDALVCSTLESSETTADACLTEAIEGATTCAEGSEGTFPDCDNTLAGATSCEEGAEGSFPDCDGTVAALVAQVLSALAPTADAGADASVAEGTLDVTLDGSASAGSLPLPAGNDLTFNWVQTAGPSVILDGAETATPTFDAPSLDGLQETLSFELTVNDLFGSASDVVDVVVTNIDTAETSIGVTVASAAAVLTLSGPDPAPTLTPDGSSTSTETYFVEIDTSEGTEHVDNELLKFTVTDPNGMQTPENFDSVADTKTAPAQLETDIRTYTFGLDLPGRLADGSYTIGAAYDGSAMTDQTLTVLNAAPSITGTPGIHTGRASFDAETTPLQLTLDDANWGTYDDSPVTELASLSFAVLDATANPVLSGFTFSHDRNGDSTFETGILNLSSENGNAAISVPVKVAYDDLVTDGVYTVIATVTDNNGASSELEFLVITLVKANHGFSIAVNDGGQGVSLGTASANNGNYDTSADPLELQITGTLNAATLTLDIPDFTSSDPEVDDPIPTEGMTVSVFLEGADPLVDTPALSGLVAGNTVVLDLTGIGISETSVFLVFEVQVLDGTDNGTYSTAVDLLSTADE